MKKLLIVPILALAMAALSPAAYANHGGAHTPDAEPDETHCRTFFAGHGDCSVTSPTPGKVQMGTGFYGGVPTADGWHMVFTARIIDNDTDTILSSKTVDRIAPYTGQICELVGCFELPTHPRYSIAIGGQVETTSASCAVDVAAGIGGQIACTYNSLDMMIPWVV